MNRLSGWLTLALAATIMAGPAPAQEGNRVYDQAEAFYAEYTWDKAIELFQKFVAENPADPRVPSAEYKILDSRLRLRKWDEFEAAATAFIEKYRRTVWSARANNLLAQFLYEHSRWSNWERIGNLHAEALREYRAAIGRRPMDSAEKKVYAGLLFDAAGFYLQWYDDRAKKLCEDHLQTIIGLNVDDNTTARAYLLLGQLYGQRYDDEKKMAAAWLTVVKDYPKSDVADQALYQLANWDNGQGRYVQARARYLELRRRYPKSEYEDDALERIKDIEAPRLSLRISETHLPGAKIPTRLTTRNIKGATLTAYRVDLFGLLDDSPENMQSQEALLKHGKQVAQWHVDAVDKGDYQHWYSGRLDSPLRQAGFYVVKAVADGQPTTTDWAVLNITSLVIAQHYAANQIVSYVASRVTRQPVEGVDVRVLDTDNRKPVQVARGKTDGDGLLRQKLAPKDDSRRLMAVGLHGDEPVIQDQGLYAWWRDSGVELNGYIYTDRPVYRPGNEVQFKAILRNEEAGDFTNLPNREVTITINDARGEEKYKQTLTTDKFGTAGGKLQLDEEPTLGVWRINVEVGDDSVGGQFRVEEYRKPEFKVTVGKPLTDVRPGRGAAVPIDAQYYFGAPVADAEVHYVVERQPYYHYYWWGGPWDWFYAGFREPEYRHWWGRQVVTEGTVKTDAEGRAVVEFVTTEDSADYTYTIQAEVADVTRRVVEQGGSFTVTHKGYFLSADANQGLYRPDDKVTVTVKAETADSQPLEKPVTATLWRMKWVPEVKDPKTGDVKIAAHWERDAKAWQQDQRVVTDPATGKEDLLFDAPADGYYTLDLSAPDTYDPNVQVTTTAAFWVASDAWKGRNWDLANLQLIPEKDLYERGETARILINSPVPDGAVLLTIGADAIYETRLVRLTGANQVVELPMLDNYSPNVFISALVVGFREVYFADTELLVPPTNELLNVTVESDQEEYKPRTTGTFTIKTTDSAGQPVAAQVSLGITDESVYAIQEEFVQPIGAYFYGRHRGNEIRRVLSFERWGEYDEEVTEEAVKNAMRRDRGAAEGAMADGMAPPAPMATAAGEPEAAAKPGGMGGGGGGEEPIQIREFFPDTIKWLPAVETDQNGVATVTVDFPDSLTTWRATARALTADTKVGQKVASVVTTKDLIARLQAPRFFTQLDEATISLVVTNKTSAQQQVAVGFQIDGLELVGDDKDSVTLAPNGQARVDRTVRAVKPGKATITVTARGPNDSDGVKMTYDVLPHGADKFASAAGRVEGGKATFTLDLPAERREDATALTFTLAPTLGATLLDALPYLADYPYGCVEQTTSKFIPAVLVARTLDITGGAGGGGLPQAKQVPQWWTRRGLDTLPDMVKLGIKRLADMQNSDGGFGWFGGMRSNVYMSAYVTYGLLQARLADFTLPEGILERSTTFLADNLHLIKSREDSLCYVSWVLSEAVQAKVLKPSGEQTKAMEDALQGVYANREDLNDYTRALLILTMKNRGEDEKAAVVWRNLQARKIETEHGVHWGDGRWGWYWSDDQIETTAFSLLACLRVEPDNALAAKAVQWLVMNRTGNRWYNTKDTATAIYALTTYADQKGELDANYKATLKVNGKEVKTWQVTKDNALTLDGQVTVDPSLLKSGQNTIELTQDGKGSAWYSALLTYYTTEDPITAASSYMSADRQYFRVVNYTDEDKVRRTKLEPIRNGETIASGEEIEVQVTIDAENDFDYVAFSDPKPAGCEPVDQTSGGTWGGSYMYRELHDEEVTFFADSLRQGKTNITYRLRAESPGTFRALPHNGFSMYRPDVRCLSDEDIVRIGERKASEG